MSYTLHRTAPPPRLDAEFDSPDWSDAEVIEVANFHSKSSNHHPRTRAKMLYDDAGLYLHFHVEDQYVRAVAQQHQDMVCRDSCVEAFLEPRSELGYFNFEFNCGGTLLLYHIVGSESNPEDVTTVSDEWLEKIQIYATMPKIVEPEMTEPTTWRLAAHIPFALFQHYTNDLATPTESSWRGNFYKCADRTSHPHWGSWQPVGEVLGFHKPEIFAPLLFED